MYRTREHDAHRQGVDELQCMEVVTSPHPPTRHPPRLLEEWPLIATTVGREFEPLNYHL
jgi:hypothetical protein